VARKRHAAEQIISMLRTAEIEIGKGQPIRVVVKKLGITDQTYYRWRKEYGGLRIDQAKQGRGCIWCGWRRQESLGRILQEDRRSRCGRRDTLQRKPGRGWIGAAGSTKTRQATSRQATTSAPPRRKRSAESTVTPFLHWAVAAQGSGRCF